MIIRRGRLTGNRVYCDKCLLSMAAKQSAGILLYRKTGRKTEVFLVHPGGPFWKNKDAGAWTIPKGEFDDGEEALAAAIREFKEETGVDLAGDFVALAPVVQKGGKKVYAWAIAGDIDAGALQSNSFSLEWPPKSGKMNSFPEIDRGAWFTLAQAKEKINPAQIGFLAQLEELTA